MHHPNPLSKREYVWFEAYKLANKGAIQSAGDAAYCLSKFDETFPEASLPQEKLYTISLEGRSFEKDTKRFHDWLALKGHQVKIDEHADESVNGIPTKQSPAAGRIIDGLWEQFLNSTKQEG